jgi:hypothetical protein
MNLRNNKEEVWQLRRKFVAIAMKIYAKSITYNADAECVTQNHHHLRRKSVAISMKIYLKTKITTHMLYVRRNFVENCDELSLLLRRVW